MNLLVKQYSALLQKAEQTTSRNETIKLIRESTKDESIQDCDRVIGITLK